MCAPPNNENQEVTSTAKYQSLVGQPSSWSTESYGLLLLLLSTLFFSLMGPFIKLAESNGVSAIEQVLIRAIFQGSLVLAAMFYFVEEAPSSDTDGATMHQVTGIPVERERIRLIQQPFGPPKVRRVVVARGLIGGLGFCLTFLSLAALPLGDASALLGLSPVVTVFGSWIFLGETLYSSTLFSTAASIIGLMLIARPSSLFHQRDDDDLSPRASIAHVTALLGSCATAGAVMLVRKAGKTGVHSFQLLFSWCFFGIIFAILLSSIKYWATGHETPQATSPSTAVFWPRSFVTWLEILCMCVFGTAAHFLLNYAGRLPPASLTSLVRSSNILWGYVFEVLFFSQVPDTLTLLGAFLICASLLAVAAQQYSREQQRKQETEALIQEYSNPIAYGSTATSNNLQVDKANRV